MLEMEWGYVFPQQRFQDILKQRTTDVDVKKYFLECLEEVTASSGSQMHAALFWHSYVYNTNMSSANWPVNKISWSKPISVSYWQLYISGTVRKAANLPGTGDTVIKQAVPPGGDRGIALCSVEACDLPNVETRVRNFC